MQCESVNNQSTCIDSSQICNGVQECPLGDDENSHLCGSYFELSIIRNFLREIYILNIFLNFFIQIRGNNIVDFVFCC